MTGRPVGRVPGGPYKTWRHAYPDVAEVYEQGRRSNSQGTLGEANLARLHGTGCDTYMDLIRGLSSCVIPARAYPLRSVRAAAARASRPPAIRLTLLYAAG